MNEESLVSYTCHAGGRQGTVDEKVPASRFKLRRKDVGVQPL
jgi:hypothetical protein